MKKFEIRERFTGTMEVVYVVEAKNEQEAIEAYENEQHDGGRLDEDSVSPDYHIETEVVEIKNDGDNSQESI